MKNIIETRNLTKRFGTLMAVNNINLAIKEGGIFGLLVFVGRDAGSFCFYKQEKIF